MLNSMKDRSRFLFGMCRFVVKESMESLMNRACRARIELYQIYTSKDSLSFYCTPDQKKKVKTVFPDAVEMETTGVLGFLLREMKRPFHWVLLLWIILFYLFLNHTLFEIQFQSTSQNLQYRIEEYLRNNGITPGVLIQTSDFDQLLKEELKREFVHDISWIEVKRSGSLLKISFNHKETAEFKSFQTKPLVSDKHAMVIRFELLHGVKKVQYYQIVQPGDVLVESYLLDSSGKLQNLFVSGKVYGMTWYTISSELNHSTLEVLDFLRLLYECRKQIEKEIDEDEQILKENILQVTSSEGKIKMDIHYTCLEEITRK